MDVLETASRTTKCAPGDPPARRADGDGEPAVGLYAHPGRAEESESSRGTSTIATILKAQGIPPSGERPTLWQAFLRAHWNAMVAADFFTTEVWTVLGLVTYYTLFVIELHSRRVSIVGSTPHPDEAFVRQVVRQLTIADEGVLRRTPRLPCFVGVARGRLRHRFAPVAW